jgi:pimeloyl-ACP methyl ester carboxylesterase
VFGLSSGGIIALETAHLLPDVARIAVYEPPFSIAGSSPIEWLPRFDDEIAMGDIAAALITALKGAQTSPWVSKLPRFMLTEAADLPNVAHEPADG